MVARRPVQLDTHIGARIRAARRAAGISQGSLGARIGLSAQMLAKYEAGASRIAASTLVNLAGSLSMPVAEFLELPASEQGEGA